MAESIKVNGLTTIWKVSEYIRGRMAGSTRVNTKMTRNTDSEYIHGLT